MITRTVRVERRPAVTANGRPVSVCVESLKLLGVLLYRREHIVDFS